MSAQELGFPDSIFTHSFTSFAFHCLGDHDAAAKQVYRTLKSSPAALPSRPFGSLCHTSMPFSMLTGAHVGKTGPCPRCFHSRVFRRQTYKWPLWGEDSRYDNIICSNKDCYLSVPDLQRWAQLARSYLGSLPTGWTKEDENKWHEAVDEIVGQLKSRDGISMNERGETVMKMIACVAVATK